MKRHVFAVITFTTTGALLATIDWPPTPRVIWNATASVPVGLYGVRPTQHFAVNDIVIAIPPEPWAHILAERRLLPHGIPLIKKIAAVARQTVCRVGLLVLVDGVVIGNARATDTCGRSLPVWQGCATIQNNHLFLMNTNEPASFDGRYFGPVPTSSIEGRAIPLWTFKTFAPKLNCETNNPENHPSNTAKIPQSSTRLVSKNTASIFQNANSTHPT